MNILLGITGSVAATLAPKIIARLEPLGEVKVVVTKHALPFIPYIKVYEDNDEWQWLKNPLPVQGRFKESDHRSRYEKGDEILHIELRKWADALVIAPCSANTLAKLANGLCDNLLTSIARAWDFKKPFYVAPSMNTFMLHHPVTRTQFNTLIKWGIQIIPSQEKTLACGDVGDGAMANIDDIYNRFRWRFPVSTEGIPVGEHHGAFGTKRKHDIHSGVDLYCKENTSVYAVERGIITVIKPFTGPSAGYPWWLDTQCLAIEGQSGVVNYGEIEPDPQLSVGSSVYAGQKIGKVVPVLREGKERPDIPGHSRFMLHLEWYKRGTFEVWRGWQITDPKQPDELLDPTPKLFDAIGAPERKWTIDN